MAKLALKGGKPVREKGWPSWPIYDECELKALKGALEERMWGGGVGRSNPREKEIEERFASFHDCRYGVAVSTGTAALHVALLAAGVGEGDEVIVPAITWLATGSAALMTRAELVFCDVHPESYCLDAEKLESLITSKTKAVITVHNFGTSSDMEELLEMTRKHNLLLIEDCARAHGFRWKDRSVGSLGDMGCFSFQRGKFMTCGEGGMITTNDRKLFERCRSIKDCGRTREGDAHSEGVTNYYNYRLTEFQSAILLCQLERLKEQRERRKNNSEYLSGKLEGIEGIKPVKPDPRLTEHQPWPYLFRYDPEAFKGVPIGRFREALNAEGIPCGGIDPPLYRALRPSKEDWERFPEICPVAERAPDELVSLPQNLFLSSKEDMDDIAEAIAKIRENADELL